MRDMNRISIQLSVERGRSILSYPINTQPDDNDMLLITSPDFPEVTSYAKSIHQARAVGLRAIEEAIAARMDTRLDIPLPSRGNEQVHIAPSTAIQVLLYNAMQTTGVPFRMLYTEARDVS